MIAKYPPDRGLLFTTGHGPSVEYDKTGAVRAGAEMTGLSHRAIFIEYISSINVLPPPSGRMGNSWSVMLYEEAPRTVHHGGRSSWLLCTPPKSVSLPSLSGLFGTPLNDSTTVLP